MPFQVSFPDMERELQQGLGNPFPTDAGIVLGNWSLRVGASGSIVGTTEAKEIKTTKHAERDAKHLSPKMKDCRGLELHLLSNGALVCALGPHACRRRRSPCRCANVVRRGVRALAQGVALHHCLKARAHMASAALARRRRPIRRPAPEATGGPWLVAQATHRGTKRAHSPPGCETSLPPMSARSSARARARAAVGARCQAPAVVSDVGHMTLTRVPFGARASSYVLSSVALVSHAVFSCGFIHPAFAYDVLL